jgi:hypothetical protein
LGSLNQIKGSSDLSLPNYHREKKQKCLDENTGQIDAERQLRRSTSNAQTVRANAYSTMAENSAKNITNFVASPTIVCAIAQPELSTIKCIVVLRTCWLR